GAQQGAAARTVVGALVVAERVVDDPGPGARRLPRPGDRVARAALLVPGDDRRVGRDPQPGVALVDDVHLVETVDQLVPAEQHPGVAERRMVAHTGYPAPAERALPRTRSGQEPRGGVHGQQAPPRREVRLDDREQ